MQALQRRLPVPPAPLSLKRMLCMDRRVRESAAVCWSDGALVLVAEAPSQWVRRAEER